MYGQISQIIKSLVTNISDKEINSFVDICKPTSIQQGDYFLTEGQIPKKFGFITKGLVRYLYVDNEGREFTKAFLCENSFVSSYTAMKNQTPSFFSIQALTQTEILEITYAQWTRVRRSNAIWDKFLIALLEKGYSIKEKRERDLLLLDAESRYKIFREEFYHWTYAQKLLKSQ